MDQLPTSPSPPATSIGRRLRSARGFSLIELMVAMTIFVLMLSLVGRVVSDVRNSWSRAASRVTQFRDSRLAFELITRNISQATLNTYFDYEYGTDGSTPERYVRKSELHFICGQTAPGSPGSLLSGETSDVRPGHGIFFQAYLGHTLDNNLDNLGSLLNGRGYYIQYTDGTELAPKFLGASAPERWRFRLWEWLPASEADTEQLGNEIYTADGIVGNGWFDDEGKLGWTAGGNDGRSRLVAENIIALLISPRASLPEPDDRTSYLNAVRIAPSYAYDTRSHGPAPGFGATPPAPSLQHLLPPLVQVTLVAIDEPSAIRLETTSSDPSTPPNLLYNGTGFTDAGDYEDDLRDLEESLVDKGLNYRIFSTTIALRGAKWDAGSFSN